MKIKNYKIFEKENIDDVNLDDDQIYGSPKKEEEYDPNEDMDHFLYLLRSHFKNLGISDIQVYMDADLNVEIYAILNKREKIKNLLNIFNAVQKVSTDLLPQYDSEFELYESKSGDPVLLFTFW